ECGLPVAREGTEIKPARRCERLALPLGHRLAAGKRHCPLGKGEVGDVASSRGREEGRDARRRLGCGGSCKRRWCARDVVESDLKRSGPGTPNGFVPPLVLVGKKGCVLLPDDIAGSDLAEIADLGVITGADALEHRTMLGFLHWQPPRVRVVLV